MALKLEAVQVSPASYARIMKQTEDDIEFHFIHAALRYFFDGRLEGVRLSLFEVLHEKERLYCVMHEILGESVKILINTDAREQNFVHTATFAVMDEIFPILSQYNKFFTPYIRQDIREAVIAHPETAAFYPYRPLDEPLLCCFIDDQKCEQLVNQSITLPEDYFFVSPREKSARQMCDDQLKTLLVDEEILALRLRNLPAVGVVYKYDKLPGNLVCYEHSDGFGTISMLYCQTAHRNKRLATLVEQKICQRNLKEIGVRPFKGLTVNRPRVIEMTVKSELWTMCKDKNGNDELFFYSVYCRDELPSVRIYEN